MPAVELAFARTALTFGLRALGMKPGDALLVPDFICDVVWHGAQRAGVAIATYPVKDDLGPDWAGVAAAVDERVRALLVVHYFGQPQDLDRCRQFCDDRGLHLVEDNAHGYSGTLGGRALGTFGDVGIASPRKMMGTACGGVLYHPAARPVQAAGHLPVFPASHPAQLARTALSRVPAVRNRIRGWLDRSKDWSNPRLYREHEQPDYAIDRGSHRGLVSLDWAEVARRRRTAWEQWADFARGQGLAPVFPAVHPESCPWAFPAYAADIGERNRWLSWGARRGMAVFPWPALPEQEILADGPSLARWRRLCCFSLERGPG
jgi:hypothetical protein